MLHVNFDELFNKNSSKSPMVLIHQNTLGSFSFNTLLSSEVISK